MPPWRFLLAEGFALRAPMEASQLVYGLLTGFLGQNTIQATNFVEAGSIASVALTLQSTHDQAHC